MMTKENTSKAALNQLMQQVGSMTPEPLEPETLEAKIIHLAGLLEAMNAYGANAITAFGEKDIVIALDVARELIARENKNQDIIDQLLSERENDKAEIVLLNSDVAKWNESSTRLYNSLENEMEETVQLQAQLAAKDKLLAIARDAIELQKTRLMAYIAMDRPVTTRGLVDLRTDCELALAALSQQDTGSGGAGV